LEAFHVNKIPFSKLQEKVNGLDKDYNLMKFGLLKPREKLYADIEKRVDEMFAQGAVEEVKKLAAIKLSRTASYVLGLNQIQAYLKNEISLDRAKEIIKQETRNFAKRQLTWFRRDKDIKWIAVDANMTAENLAQEIFSQLPKAITKSVK